MKVTNCSMGCMYATGPIDKCLCSCKGAMHAMMVQKTDKVACTPSVSARCMSGQEDGDCQCACGGLNHGLYREIENFDHVLITTYKQ